MRLFRFKLPPTLCAWGYMWLERRRRWKWRWTRTPTTTDPDVAWRRTDMQAIKLVRLGSGGNGWCGWRGCPLCSQSCSCLPACLDGLQSGLYCGHNRSFQRQSLRDSWERTARLTGDHALDCYSSIACSLPHLFFNNTSCIWLAPLVFDAVIYIQRPFFCCAENLLLATFSKCPLVYIVPSYMV